jgi:hypothetical protein
MDVACTECKSRFKISDEKIPEGAAASFTCPNCKSKVSIDLRKKPLTEAVDEDEYAVDYDASEKPFDFLETGSRTALICVADEGLKKTIIDMIQSEGYQITDAPNAQAAIKKMWYHIYDLILLDENFDISKTGQNKVLSYLQGLNMTVRRQSSVVLITKSARTMDQMAAFKFSVNLLINIKDLKDLIRITAHSINAHEALYRVYKEYLRKENAV